MQTTKLTDRQIINRIYKDLSGYEIDKQDEAHVKKSKGSPVYGEINFQALNYLLDYVQIQPNDIFYDLGSGIGKVVVQTAIQTKAKKVIGIELSKLRHKQALLAKSDLKKLYPTIESKVHFINDDILTADLSDATIIYTCSTAFSGIFMKQLTKKLQSLSNGFTLISLQRLPSDKIFSSHETLKLDMSWIRKTEVNIYKK